MLFVVLVDRCAQRPKKHAQRAQTFVHTQHYTVTHTRTRQTPAAFHGARRVARISLPAVEECMEVTEGKEWTSACRHRPPWSTISTRLMAAPAECMARHIRIVQGSAWSALDCQSSSNKVAHNRGGDRTLCSPCCTMWRRMQVNNFTLCHTPRRAARA